MVDSAKKGNLPKKNKLNVLKEETADRLKEKTTREDISKNPNDQPEERIKRKDILALIISVISLLLTLASFWYLQLRPFKLMISSPVITHDNSFLPSLLFECSLCNLGAKSTVINEVKIRTYSKEKELPISLHAQQVISNEYVLGESYPLKEGKTVLSNFTSIIVPGGEVIQKKLYMKPYEDEINQFNIDNILSVDRISIDLKINNKWYEYIFNIGYDYHEKYQGGGVLVPEEYGFQPMWFSHIKPVIIKGSYIFD